MKFCFNCGTQLDDEAKFCATCGTVQEGNDAAPVVEAPVAPQPVYAQPTYTQPAYTQPAYTQPTYTQPTYAQPAYTQPSYEPTYTPPVYSQPKVNSGARALGIIGMSLGIFALLMAVIWFFTSIATMSGSIDSSYYYYDYYYYLAVEYIYCVLGTLPAGIVGLILSSKSSNGGFDSVMPRLGKIFSIISLPLCALSLLFLFVCLM